MARFGAGRSTVREALFTLRKMGLVALSAGERARVTRPTAALMVGELSGAVRQFLQTAEGVRHFQDARRLLERALCREAALRATPEQLAGLLEACEAHRTARDATSAIAADVEFHFRIAEVCRNPVLSALHAASFEWLREQRATSVQSIGAKRAAEKAHRRIYDAIRAGDPDAAERAMGEHLDEVEAHYWRAVDARPRHVGSPRASGSRTAHG